MSLPKWTDERTALLTADLDQGDQVSVSTVDSLAATLETSTRSVASKLRKLGYVVQSSAEKASAKYTEAQEAELRDLIENNSGAFTYAELAAEFANGAFSAKSVQGKVLSMELTSYIKPTPKAETVKHYTADEENIFVSMAKSGSSIEDIAQKLGKAVNSVRGKALSLLRSGAIDGIPVQASKAAPKEDALEALGDLSALSVEEIAEKLDKTVRGVKTMLTRRGLVASDYDGAGRKEKAAQ
jgi:DNA-binding NarL/FixJ family response regulator